MIIVGWFALPRASRRQVRWLVGVSAAVMVSLPGWLSLASPKGYSLPTSLSEMERPVIR